MQLPIPIGIRPGRLPGSTFVELVVTLFLLATFSLLVFPLFWGTSKAGTAHSLETAAEQAQLSLATYLPRLTDEVHPPYWSSPNKVFETSGNDWKAFFRNGEESNYLIIRKRSDTQLDLVTSSSTISINNLPDLNVDWWKKDDRVIGIEVHWSNGKVTNEFHAAWGSFIL